MTTENLGIIFAPNLLRAPNATDMNVMDLQVCLWSLVSVRVCASVSFHSGSVRRVIPLKRERER